VTRDELRKMVSDGSRAERLLRLQGDLADGQMNEAANTVMRHLLGAGSPNWEFRDLVREHLSRAVAEYLANEEREFIAELEQKP